MAIDHATHETSAFFKAIPADWYENTSGNVEAPCGWFGKLWLDSATLDAFRAELPDIDVPDIPTNEFYFVVIDNNGLCWAYTYSRDDDDSPSGAYARAEAEFARWDDDGSADDDFDMALWDRPVTME